MKSLKVVQGFDWMACLDLGKPLGADMTINKIMLTLDDAKKIAASAEAEAKRNE